MSINSLKTSRTTQTINNQYTVKSEVDVWTITAMNKLNDIAKRRATPMPGFKK